MFKGEEVASLPRIVAESEWSHFLHAVPNTQQATTASFRGFTLLHRGNLGMRLANYISAPSTKGVMSLVHTPSEPILCQINQQGARVFKHQEPIYALTHSTLVSVPNQVDG